LSFRFFKGRQSGPREIACPLCDHRQLESPLAVSSYCKGCGAYLTFKEGKIKARPKTVENPFENRPPQPKVDIDYSPREIPLRPIITPSPTPPNEPMATDTEEEEEEPPQLTSKDKPVTAPVHVLPPSAPKPIESTPFEKPVLEPEKRKQEPSKSSPDGKFPSKPLNTRKAMCFECGDAHDANALSNSTQCRKCGRMISLANHEIRSSWSSRIQTRGDVFIHKKGIVTGSTIQCHHMIVEGEFTGNVECSGDLTLRRHGKIMGKIICDRLLVEKRAKVDFLNPVETNECRIDGLVTGSIACRGRLSLEKKATLTGNIKVGTLTVADGAKHTGQIQMGRF
jgi:cytoskeletal protein CcmA (bactofilin family)